MKTLIICDDDDIIKKISNGMKSCGYDTIVYHWLLKALDNVEEIDPDLIVINASDYPRHWKTFISYTTTWKCGSGENMPRVILFAKEDFGDDEKQKAKALGVSSILQYDGDDDKFLEQLQIATLSDDMGIEVGDDEKTIDEPIIDTVEEDPIAEIIDEADNAETVPVSIAETDEIIDDEIDETIEDEIAKEEIIKQPALDDDIPTTSNENETAEEELIEEDIENEIPEEIFDSIESDSEADTIETVYEENIDDEIPDEEIPDNEIVEPENIEEAVAKDDTPEYENNIEETAAVTEIFHDIKYDVGSMMLTNPVSGVFVTGSIVSISGDEKTIVFAPDMPSDMSEMHRGDTVNALSLKTSKGMKMCSAEIADTDGTHFTFYVA